MATVQRLAGALLLLASMLMNASDANSDSARGYFGHHGPMPGRFDGPMHGPPHGPMHGPSHGPRPSNPEERSCVSQTELEARNKKLVLDYTQELFGDKNISAIDKYVAPGYIQHNPSVADGREAIKAAAAEWFGSDPVKTKMDIRHASADGNLVWVHYKEVQGEAITATVDLYRVENGMIQEHWDVIQTLEDPSKSANPHPFF